MTFPDPAFEQQRVAAAEYLHMKLEPRTKADLAIVALLSVVYAFDLAAAIFVLWNHKYPPIRSKSPFLMVILFIASAIWLVGDAQVNGNVPLAGTILAHCRGFGFWGRVLFGVCTVYAAIVARTYALYRVFYLNVPARSWRLYLLVSVYGACILIFGIIASALKPSQSAEYVPALDICNLAKPFKIAIFVFMWISYGLLAFITWKLRNIKSSFNEFREMIITCLIIFSSMTFNTAMMFSHPQYPLILRYRIVSTLYDHICTNAVWWCIMAKPVFNCMFRRSIYLQEWLAKLRKDGLQREYRVTNDQGNCIERKQIYADSTQHSDRLLIHKASEANGFSHSGNTEDKMWMSEENIAMPTIAYAKTNYSEQTGNSVSFSQQETSEFTTIANSQRRSSNADTRNVNPPHGVSWQQQADSHRENMFNQDANGNWHVL
ncbi:hypothetical protein GGI25_005772 [Coemansia spiralis]|uniref:G-protein coupled receptors family 3 profile domain-containing protein n=2 Tax=Coemansia TaxID=4863 RepID=A0A9W8G3A7_9FUNG|nr:hypothetical protein BX070DRAFT_224615 [Coemansia spiralis]KAJ1988556.1 hypothetical protein EDC05_005219 [Coemansia umbellata]KAJ2619914.1 hypothetical protein GGI26_005449 [Coemansia sp. RSA 1358]KAJ2670637.1 hypothetical protein GGI25_005772 [Coemansia spiralis]